jgi:predicted ATP-grasp superfamily ATP-dependent carboligase
VVAGIDLNGLGILRALGRAHVPVVALDTDFSKPTARTRYGRKKRVAALSGPGFVSDLLTLRSQFSVDPVLLLTQEASVATVSAERGRLSRAYRFTMPSHVLMSDLLDKSRFQELAEKHGYLIPRALRISGSEINESISSLRFPCIVKPVTKQPEYAKRFAKAYKVFSPDEVTHLWLLMRDVVEAAIVQEWIEGADSDIYFCLQYRPAAGRQSVSFVGRKLCQWPPQVGGTASCVPAPEYASELNALTDGFFSKVGYVGVCSMEYKRDARDGKFYMIEPTVGRTDYQEEIAALNGINLPLVLYCAEQGKPVSPQAAKMPRGWRDPLGYANAQRAGAHDNAQHIPPTIKIIDAYFRLDDPMPFFSLKFEGITRKFRHIARGNRSRTRPS